MKVKPIVLALGLATVTSGFAQSAVANSNGISKCIGAAINGPEIKKQQVFEHRYDCKPMEVSKYPNGITRYNGHLSHHLPLRPNDEIFYEFTIIKGKLQEDSVKTNIKKGGLDTLIGVAASAAGAFFGVPIPPNVAANVWDTLAESAARGGWEQVANATIAGIAFEAAMEESLSWGPTIQQNNPNIGTARNQNRYKQ